MRTEKEMYDLILNIAKSQPQVKAVALTGSRVNPNATKDSFQDYDVVYLVDEKKTLLRDRSWLENFGKRLIMQCPEEMTLFPATLGACFTFLMLFLDGNRIDLTLCPIKNKEEWLAQEKIVKTLWDPTHLLPTFSQNSKTPYFVKKPTQAEFLDCCNEFWWVSTYVVKGLWRQENLYAIDHLYGTCQKELRRLLTWQVALNYNDKIDTGKNDKYLLHFLQADVSQNLMGLFDFTTLAKTWESLFATQQLFQQNAISYAEKCGFSYDLQTAENVLDYCKQWYPGNL